MSVKVLDSWALIAFYEDEPAAEEMERLLQQAADGKHRLLLCAVNWGEIYYSTMREASRSAADRLVAEIAALPIGIVGVGDDLALVKQAALFKANHRMSYADCFAAALAKQHNAELVTGDVEFRAVESEVRVTWLRRPDEPGR